MEIPATALCASPAITIETTTAWRKQAETTLWEILRQDRTWVGVHAAEALISQGESEKVRKLLIEQGRSTLPRIGRLRILAQITAEPERRGPIKEIERCFLDPTAPDRKQAIESLAKLREPLSPCARALAQALATQAPDEETILPLWSLHHSGDPTAGERLILALGSDNPLARQRAGYAWRWIGTKEPRVLRALAAAADREAQSTQPRVFLLSSALHLRADSRRENVWKHELYLSLKTGPSAAAYEVGQILEPWIGIETIPELVSLLDHLDGDTRIAAARLILRFRKHP